MSLTLIGQKKGMTQVFDKDGKVVYAETCNEVTTEPNYDATRSAVNGAL